MNQTTVSAMSWGCNSEQIAEWLEDDVRGPADSDKIAHAALDAVGVTVYRGSPASPDGFTVVWTDYVANEWAETFVDAATAILRMGLIAACADDSRLFRPGIAEPYAFAREAQRLAASWLA